MSSDRDRVLARVSRMGNRALPHWNWGLGAKWLMGYGLGWFAWEPGSLGL